MWNIIVQVQTERSTGKSIEQIPNYLYKDTQCNKNVSCQILAMILEH